MKIFESMQEYCEKREFRLTIQKARFYLVWVANDNIRSADFDDWNDVKKLVDIRNA